MLIVRDKTINAWQTGIMLFVLLFANKILFLPSLLYKGAKLESFVVPIIIFIFEMGLLFLFYKLKTKFPDKSFFDIVKANLSKTVAIILFVLIMIFFLGKALFLYNVTYVFFRNQIYKDSNNYLFLFCFVPLVNFLAISGLRSMGRTMQLFFPVIFTIVVFCIVVGFFGINTKPLMFDSSGYDIFMTTLRHTSSFGDTIFLFVLMDKITIKKGEWKVVFSLAGLAMFLVSLITIIFILSYTYTTFFHSFALFEIMNYVKEYGGMGRIDIISMIVIIIFTYFHLAIYMKTFMASFHNIFKKTDEIYSVLTFNIILFILIEFVILNLENTLSFAETVLPYFSILSFGFEPIVSLVGLFWKKKEKKT